MMYGVRQEEHERMFEVESAHFWFVGTRAVIAAVLADALQGKVDGTRLLDLGCGTGYTLTRMPGGVRAVGLDNAPTALALAAGRPIGAPLVRGDATRLPFADESFDAVLALDVLEHLDRDVAAAREIRRVLKPSGVLIATAPAYRWLWSHHDEALDHRRRYRLREFTDLLRGAGFRIARASYYNCFLLPLVAASRTWRRLFPGDRVHGLHAEIDVPPHPVNALLAAVLGAERYLVTRMSLPFGVSCLVSARRGP
jgi:SAM-dependent methyltransferase